MKAITIDTPGGPEQMNWGDFEDPQPNDYEILVKVAYTAVNRADTLQRKGKYPPPPGASPLLGLELAGEIERVGKQVSHWKPGERVFGLLPGGGYAEYATIHQDMAMLIPKNLSYKEAAAIPEVFLTAFQAIHWLGELDANESTLIHAGASGVGTAAIQLAKQLKSKVIVTASKGKHQICRQLGADVMIDYQAGPFLEAVKAEGGVDVIIDFIGGNYFSQNISALKVDGRMVMLALIGGAKVEGVDLRKVLGKRLSIIGSTLRSRSLDYQIKLSQEFAQYALPLFENGTLKPVIDSEFALSDVAKAHQYMEENKNAGKIVLKVGS